MVSINKRPVGLYCSPGFNFDSFRCIQKYSMFGCYKNLAFCYRILFEDDENCLCTVTLFRRVVDEFKHKCRENK